MTGRTEHAVDTLDVRHQPKPWAGVSESGRGAGARQAQIFHNSRINPMEPDSRLPTGAQPHPRPDGRA